MLFHWAHISRFQDMHSVKRKCTANNTIELHLQLHGNIMLLCWYSYSLFEILRAFCWLFRSHCPRMCCCESLQFPSTSDPCPASPVWSRTNSGCHQSAFRRNDWEVTRGETTTAKQPSSFTQSNRQPKIDALGAPGWRTWEHTRGRLTKFILSIRGTLRKDVSDTSGRGFSRTRSVSPCASDDR